MKYSLSLIATLTASLALGGCGSSSSGGTTAPAPVAATRTIIMVWDGLRPDSINATDTPNLYALRQSGANFTDNH